MAERRWIFVGEVVVVYNGVSLYGREMKNCFVRRIVGVERIVTCVASRSHFLSSSFPLFSLWFFSQISKMNSSLISMDFKIPMPELNKRWVFFINTNVT